MKRIGLLFSTLTLCLCACNAPAPETPEDLSGYEMSQVPGTETSKAVKVTDGVKVQEGYLREGVKHGMWIDYTKEGKISLIQHYVDGQLNGPSIALDPRGQITALTEYTNGVYDGLKASYKFGRPEEEIPYVDGKIHGVMKKYYTNNKLMEEAEYRNNLQHGYYRHYNEQGIMDLEYVYEDGKKVSGGIVTPQDSTGQ